MRRTLSRLRSWLLNEGQFAVGLTLGIGAAALLYVALDASLTEVPNDLGYQERGKQEASNEGQRGPDRWFWLRRIVALEDTLAQWIMMLFTAIAAALLWQTLVATRRTVAISQEMAKDTREIGRLQTRANLHFLEYTINVPPPSWAWPNDMYVELVFKNFGPTPAREVSFDIMGDDDLIRLPFPNQGGDFPPPKFREFDPQRVKGKTTKFCGPGEVVKSHSYSMNRVDVITGVRSRRFRYVAGWIRYKDDFFVSDSDYRYCKFCFIMDILKDASEVALVPASKETIRLWEHGPDNYDM